MHYLKCVAYLTGKLVSEVVDDSVCALDKYALITSQHLTRREPQ
jgi:hypothetical protein